MPANDRTPVSQADADAYRALAADERAKGELLAQHLEDIAENGLPDPATGTPWAELRDQALAKLAAGQNERRVA